MLRPWFERLIQGRKRKETFFFASSLFSCFAAKERDLSRSQSSGVGVACELLKSSRRAVILHNLSLSLFRNFPVFVVYRLPVFYSFSRIDSISLPCSATLFHSLLTWISLSLSFCLSVFHLQCNELSEQGISSLK